MVLSSPAPDVAPAPAGWLDEVDAALALATRGILILVDHAHPAQLRPLYLRLRARVADVELVGGVRALMQLPVGSTVVLAPNPAEADWMNLHRPQFVERGYRLVLWCSAAASTALAREAPDFFDWISLRVECPAALAAHAVAALRAAIGARRRGVVWRGPGLEESLAALRPRRTIRTVAIDGYDALVDQFGARDPRWLVVTAVDDVSRERRVRWALAESGRRLLVIVRDPAAAPAGWPVVHAQHTPVDQAVLMVTAGGGRGRLAALAGLEPEAITAVAARLAGGEASEALEARLVAADDPGAALALRRTAATAAAEVDFVEDSLRRGMRSAKEWDELSRKAEALGEYEAGLRWLDHAIALETTSPIESWARAVRRGALLENLGDLAAAAAPLERSLVALAAVAPSPVGDEVEALARASLARIRERQGRLGDARRELDQALAKLRQVDATHGTIPEVLDALVRVAYAQGDLPTVRRVLAESVALQREGGSPADELSAARRFRLLGLVLAEDGELAGARAHFERALAIEESVLGSRHADLDGTLMTLADLARRLGDRDAATHAFERVIELSGATAGLDRATTCGAHLELADMLQEDGDLAGAGVHAEQAVAIAERLAGGTEPSTLSTALVKLSGVRLAQGDIARALAASGRALDLAEALASRGPGLIRAELAHAAALAAGGDLRARELIVRALEREPTYFQDMAAKYLAKHGASLSDAESPPPAAEFDPRPA